MGERGDCIPPCSLGRSLTTSQVEGPVSAGDDAQRAFGCGEGRKVGRKEERLAGRMWRPDGTRGGGGNSGGGGGGGGWVRIFYRRKVSTLGTVVRYLKFSGKSTVAGLLLAR